MARIDREMKFCRDTDGRVGRWMVVWAIVALAGCTPLTEEEQAYIEKQREQEDQQELVNEALRGSTRQTEAVEMVKSKAAPDGNGTIENWVDRQMALIDTTIMFPRWTARPRGADKFEVRYEYSTLDSEYTSEKQGFAWTVDLVLKIVGAVRDIEETQSQGQAAQERISHQILREQEERKQQFSLE